jgi:protein-tyrosine phosphatase
MNFMFKGIKLKESEVRHPNLTEILMVCTANTCRSPLAAVIMRNELARKLKTTVEALPENGYLVRSAGPWADVGMGISNHTKLVLGEMGYPVPERGARELTSQLTEGADFIYAMTQWHLLKVLDITPGVEDRIQLLDKRGQDISDPIGENYAFYRAVGAVIQQCVRERVEEICSGERKASLR